MYCVMPTANSLSFIDYPNGEHCLTVMFTGCDNYCKGCQNKELQKHGKVIDEIDIGNMFIKITDLCERMNTKNIVFQGGDPLDEQNENSCYLLCLFLKREGYNICIYTGKKYNQVSGDLLKFIDYIKCGKYDETKKVNSEKTDKYLQLASTNQKIYKNGELVSEKGRIYF